MLHAKAFANASTTVVLGLYIVCRIVTVAAPDFMYNVAKSWFHTFSLDSLKGPTSMDFGTFLLGGVILAILVWVTTYTTIALYNKWAK